MAACADDPRSAAWQELAHVVRIAGRSDARLAGLWPPQDVGPVGASPAWCQLARLLHVLALCDTETDTAVTDWLARHATRPDTRAAQSTGTLNTIGDQASLHGPSVQSRDIHGGIHFYPVPRPTRSRVPSPRQLPPLTAHFVGREQDLRTLDALRARHPSYVPQVLAVCGLAGAGKTTLASRWLHAHADEFPDGQLHADLRAHASAGSGPVSAMTVLEAFLVALGVAAIPPDLSQRSALWRSLTAELRLAVLLDDAVSAAQVRPLLLSSASALTVVTSRSDLSGLRIEGASVHRLAGLPEQSALDLLAVGGGARVAEELAAAREVVALCGRLPLAVGLASAQLALRPHRSVSALARHLSEGRGALDALRLDGEAVMHAALDMSYDLLPPAPARLYRRMGLLPVDHYDFGLLAAIDDDPHHADASAGTVDIAAHMLVEANLVEETASETYGFHDLVRSHARRLGEEGEDAGQQDRTMRRFVDWCLATAAVAESILSPSHRLPGHDDLLHAVEPTPLDGPEQALTWLDTRRNALMGAVRHCARAGWHDRCWRLTDVMWSLFLRFRPSQMWIEAHRLGFDAALRSGSRPGAGRMLTSGAIGLRDAGEYTEAAQWYRQALGMATADGDTRQQAQALNGLGHISLLDHRLDDARDHFEEALRLREAIGYVRGVALSRGRLGETALAAGDPAGAIRHFDQAHRELAALGETYEATRVLALLGQALCLHQDHDEGTRRLRHALEGFRVGDARSELWEGRCLELLGAAAESRGDRAEAGRHYEAARDLFRRLNPGDAHRLDDRLGRL
ncbi:tetratricopeptide repeat protein [Streptomyces sp. DSM 110735]|nr:tetratricopeptide repeat protein [Streptomyces sp. DSM 110735]